MRSDKKVVTTRRETFTVTVDAEDIIHAVRHACDLIVPLAAKVRR